MSLSGVKGTGPNDRIIKADVTNVLNSNLLSQDTNVSEYRKRIAERLSYSKQNVPHYYVTVSVQIDELLRLREKLNTGAKSKISVNDMIIKATSLAAV